MSVGSVLGTTLGYGHTALYLEEVTLNTLQVLIQCLACQHWYSSIIHTQQLYITIILMNIF